jgi:hypothetical protein
MIFQFNYTVAYSTLLLQTEVCSRRREVVWKTVKNRGRWHLVETRAEWAPSADQIERTSPGRGIDTPVRWQNVGEKYRSRYELL